jgi:hypothetical protein
MRMASLLAWPLILTISVGLYLPSPAFAKLKPISESIEIKAPPKFVFEAIRKERDTQSVRRKTIAFDGRIAKIDEQLVNVPVYGKVHCLWEETEYPYQKIDYRMIESDKFKEAYGSWMLNASADKTTTRLELKNYIDTNLCMPFADQVTRRETMGSEKERLARVKSTAEAEYNREIHNKIKVTDAGELN